MRISSIIKLLQDEINLNYSFYSYNTHLFKKKFFELLYCTNQSKKLTSNLIYCDYLIVIMSFNHFCVRNTLAFRKLNHVMSHINLTIRQ